LGSPNFFGNLGYKERPMAKQMRQQPRVTAGRWSAWIDFPDVVIPALGIITATAGILGLLLEAFAEGKLPDLVNYAYRFLLLYYPDGGDLPSEFLCQPIGYWLLKIARLTGILTLSLGIWKIYRERIRNWFCARRLSKVRFHTVLLGVTRESLLLARIFHQQPESKQVLMLSEEPGTSEQLACQAEQTDLVWGAPSASLLEAANARGAARVIITAPTDAAALAAADAVYHQTGGSSDPRRFLLLRDLDLARNVRFDHFMGTEFEIVNLATLQAAWVVSEYPLDDWAWVRGQHRIHAVIIGFTALGESLLRLIAVTAQARDFEPPWITVLDPDPEACRARFQARYPGAAPDLVQVQFQSWRPGVDPITENTVGPGSPQVTAMFVALEDESQAIATALSWHEVAETNRWHVAPIFVQIAEAARVEKLFRTALQEQRDPGAPPMSQDFAQPFHALGSLDRILPGSVLMEDRADALAREFHKRYQQRQTDKSRPAARDWPKLSATFKDANRRAALHAAVKLRGLGYHLPAGLDAGRWIQDPGCFPQRDSDLFRQAAILEHNSWWAERAFDGWRPDPVRNDTMRRHPNMVPFDQLDASTKEYDYGQLEDLRKCLSSGSDKPIREDRWIELKGGHPALPDKSECFLTLLASIGSDADSAVVDGLFAAARNGREPEDYRLVLLVPRSPALQFAKDPVGRGLAKQAQFVVDLSLAGTQPDARERILRRCVQP
jgi:hypothetical protein